MATSSTTVASPRWRRWTDRRALLALALLAYALRLIPVLHAGGLAFYGRYDDGVYYSAADALSFGRAPYRDFVLLHPPLIMVVLLPFAVLGRLTSDVVGWEVARLFFMGLGALNTVLVATIARRWGRTAMLVAGLMYACWYPAAYAEQTNILEPLGGLFVLLALWLLIRLDRAPTIRAEWIAGGCLGFAEATKIWYVAPWGVLVLWLVLSDRPRSAVRLVVGGIGSLAVVALPFLIASRGRMLDMVVRDQLFRPPAPTGRLGRITGMLGINTFTDGHLVLRHVLAALLLLAIAAFTAAALKDRASWPIVAVLLIDITVLVTGPVYFRHYNSLIAAPTTLVVAIGVARLRWSARIGRWGPVVPVVVVGCLLGSGVAVARSWAGYTFPAKAIQAALPSGCIAADDPAGLIETNRLSSDLRAGCPVPVDITGLTYDALNRSEPGNETQERTLNPAWHEYLESYLSSASAFLLMHPSHDGLSATNLLHYRRRYPVLTQAGRVVLRDGTDSGYGSAPLIPH